MLPPARPLLPPGCVTTALDISQERLIALLDLGKLWPGWNVACPGAKARELRIHSAALTYYASTGQRLPADPASLIADLLPADAPITTVSICRTLNCSQGLIARLLNAGVLTLLPGELCRRGRGGNMAEAVADANRKMAESADQTSIALKKLADQQQAIKERSSEATEEIGRRTKAQLELNEALEAYNVAMGANPEAAKLQGEHNKNKIQDAADVSVINTKQNLLDNDYQEQQRLEGIVKTLAGGQILREAKLDKNGLPAQLEGYQKDMTVQEAAIKKQQAAVNEAQAKVYDIQKDVAIGNSRQVNVDVAQEDADKEKAKLADMEQDKNRLAAAIEGNKRETEKFQLEAKNYEAAKTALTELKNTIHELALEIATLRKNAGEDSKQRTLIEGIHAATVTHGPLPAGAGGNGGGAGIQDGGIFGKGLAAEAGDAAQVVAGNASKVSAQGQKVLMDIGALIAGHSVTLEQAARAIQSANANQQNFKAALDAMERTAEAMKEYSVQTDATLKRIMTEIRSINSRHSTLTGMLGQNQ